MFSYHPSSEPYGGSMSHEETALIRKEMEDRRIAMVKEVEESLSKIKTLLESQPLTEPPPSDKSPEP